MCLHTWELSLSYKKFLSGKFQMATIKKMHMGVPNIFFISSVSAHGMKGKRTGEATWGREGILILGDKRSCQMRPSPGANPVNQGAMGWLWHQAGGTSQPAYWGPLMVTDRCTVNIDIIRICIGIPLATHTGEALYLLEVPESGESPPILHRLPGNC